MADLTLFYTSQNGIGYSAPILDPWFITSPENDSRGMYLAANYVNVMACLETTRLCIVDSSKCTEWAGAQSVLNMAMNNTIDMSPMQAASAIRLSDAASRANLYQSIRALGPAGNIADQVGKFVR